MTEEIISREKLRRNRVRVTVGSGSYIIPVSSVPPGTGSLDTAFLIRAQRDTARTDASGFLEYAERSTGQLRKKLVQLGYSKEIAEETVAWATEYGFVNDLRFCELFIRSKMMGAMRLRRELINRGVSPDAVQEAITPRSDHDSFRELVALVSRKYGDVTPVETARRRASGWLQRRGYTSDLVYRVLKEAL